MRFNTELRTRLRRSGVADAARSQCARPTAPNHDVADDPYAGWVTGHVFISYSRDDVGYVTGLAAYLRDLGVPLWVDDAIGRGERFAEIIETQILDCAAFVPVLTPAAVASEWVRREISYAYKHDKPILPLLLVPCQLPLLVHDLVYEDVTTGARPSTGFLESLHSRVGAGVRRQDPARPYARLRGVIARIEEVARDNGSMEALAALTDLVPRTNDPATLQYRVQRLRTVGRDLRAVLTARLSDPAATVWRARLRVFQEEVRSAIWDLLAATPEMLDAWVEGWLNIVGATRRAVLFALDDDIREWQFQTLQPMARQCLEQCLPAGPHDAPEHATRLAQSVGDRLRREIDRSLPDLATSAWGRVTAYAEHLVTEPGRDRTSRADVRTAVVARLADIATGHADRLAGVLVDGLVDVLTAAGATLPEPTADLAELDSIEAALVALSRWAQ